MKTEKSCLDFEENSILYFTGSGVDYIKLSHLFILGSKKCLLINKILSLLTIHIKMEIQLYMTHNSVNKTMKQSVY